MRRGVLACLFSLLWVAVATSSTLAEDSSEAGFRPIFDGKSLSGWKGDENYWKVVDGAITGEITPDRPLSRNIFLVWQHGDVDDFELRLQFRITGSDAANSGIQFRGTQRPDGQVVGYQADIDRGGQWVGGVHDEARRGPLARRGSSATALATGPLQSKPLDGAENLGKLFRKNDWNDYLITARGPRITLQLNGTKTAEFLDEHPTHRDLSGLLALQLHAGPPMKIEFRNLRLKRLPLEDGWKKVVFIAGRPSHGYFSHEHNAGCLLLKASLDAAQRSQGLRVVSTAYTNGWPQDPGALDNADCVVSYCDGGPFHYLNVRLDEFDSLVRERGIGLVCLHFAVETTKGAAGDKFLNWIGGYFEPFWSVNPHWTAEFKSFPQHPVTHGVEPFEINDEWYYHMRFVPEMAGVTPILTALPPRETLNRPDGPHSGNPEVRAAVLERKEPQHVAWAYDRPQGNGRGFGFTGGHFHRNWQHDDFRKLVLNAIVWAAGAEVPEEGVTSPTPSVEQMEANQDEKKPDDFRFEPPPRNKPASTSAIPQLYVPKPAYSSPVVTTRTPGHAVDVDVDITGAEKLFLIVTDTADGMSCDWADWARPRLSDGTNEKPLTELNWDSIMAGWGSVHVNQNADGGPLRIHGADETGLGTHAPSLIEYTLPPGHSWTRFLARAGLDDGGANQNGGASSSVQFHVFTEPPGLWMAIFGNNRRQTPGASHDASEALNQLTVHPDLRVSLFAAEPVLSNPSSIDVDHRGRVWVCEAINYRAFRNADVIGQNRPADRILILSDDDGDGTAEKTTVFYQGHDVDSAHGILVLPDPDGQRMRALISVGDSIFFLIDDDGDLRADRKEVLFTGIGGVQHDHGVHAAHFGPDGRLYFNFGNEGHQLRDRDGKPIVDSLGNEVNDSRHPYQEGMVFRCRPDGTGVETLAWNFRNNWELCVDSFGTIWQSDNDDDGNRGVRINYVMDYGNYGYRDEMTGASWSTPRTGWEEQLPLRHWHLNDPGVVPNLLLTGAGAPTGICVYEGDALPEQFRGALIHCDAGPNIVRAYLPRPDGAGYSAESVDLLDGARDHWFRPSDVAVAPDGSLIVADWYDPGVGGHRMQDADRGRLFRISSATRPVAINTAELDLSNPEGAVAALRSPNMATRVMAWTALKGMGEAARPALMQLASSGEPAYLRARALWLLFEITPDGNSQQDLREMTIKEDSPDLRIVALREAREALVPESGDARENELAASTLLNLLRRLQNDPQPSVLRECCLSLHALERSPAYDPQLWAHLASRYDGNDRWYLEALGIAATGHWDDVLTAWLAGRDEGRPFNKPERDIIWRSRGSATSGLLARLIIDPSTPEEEVPRFVRALDFQQGPEKETALQKLAFSLELPESRGAFVRAESMNRLTSVDVENDPQQRQAIDRLLAESAGTEQFVRLVARFNLSNRYPELLETAIAKPQSQVAVEAIRTLYDKKQGGLIHKALAGKDRERTETILEALTTAADKRSVDKLVSLMNDEQAPQWLRRGAVKALAGSHPGALALLEIAKQGGYDEILKPTIAAALTGVSWSGIRGPAEEIFPPPPGRNAQPLPPLSELAARTGKVAEGRVLFNTTGTCNKCHRVNGIGLEIGPDLSEIGKKLSKTALIESILYPSAGISHNYESWLVVTDDGQIYTGLLASETDEVVKLKDEKGLIREIPVSSIEDRRKQDVSMMPADLQKLLTADELVDIVEYLASLKEKSS